MTAKQRLPPVFQYLRVMKNFEESDTDNNEIEPEVEHNDRNRDPNRFAEPFEEHRTECGN